METAKDVLAAYEKLDLVERLRVLSALHPEEDDDWDKQMQADAESGKLDKVFAADRAAFKAGQCREI